MGILHAARRESKDKDNESPLRVLPRTVLSDCMWLQISEAEGLLRCGRMLAFEVRFQ